MAETLSIDSLEQWSKTLPNGTVVGLREFAWSTGKDPAGPQCFIVDQPAFKVVDPHFHIEDEFQIVTAGDGRLGRHPIRPLAVHYSGAYTPYGPIVPGAQGIQYYTLRPKRDPGAQFLPEARDNMKPAPKRFYMGHDAPGPADLPSLRARQGADLSVLLDQTEEGTASWLLTAGPDASFTVPSAENTGGQYIVVTGGSAVLGGQVYGLWSTAFVWAGERSYEASAGPDGLQAIVMQFPVRHENADLIIAPAAEQWHCPLCGFVYDESEGLDIDNIAAGTPFSAIASDWTCPNCDAEKLEFERL
jgi:rubredoxin